MRGLTLRIANGGERCLDHESAGRHHGHLTIGDHAIASQRHGVSLEDERGFGRRHDFVDEATHDFVLLQARHLEVRLIHRFAAIHARGFNAHEEQQSVHVVSQHAQTTFTLCQLLHRHRALCDIGREDAQYLLILRRPRQRLHDEAQDPW